MRGYTYQQEDRNIARARGVELPMSPKKTYEVLNAIRGKALGRAKTFLEEVVALERAVPFRRYNQETAHKRGIGPGRYPKKVARHLLQVLQNAEANAEFEGLDVDRLYVAVAASSRGKIQKAQMPRAHGRSTAWNEQTTSVEIILKEKAES
ncbi:MAG: 50S ribosomal protein L22 [Thermoplasmata archaeon]|jgi:large subunit ribosomal protein L22|nr:50S ribosomal protein L22 [Thermoplasmata archaeon]MCI4342249.1 50S ribosomal protein L22 [Thermoplasmata archaeon]